MDGGCGVGVGVGVGVCVLGVGGNPRQQRPSSLINVTPRIIAI